MPDVTMPRLSDSMEEGTILKWLKDAGDEVAKGEELVEIETDKATMTYEADADGTLEIVAEEGSTLSIGEVIARIGEGSGSGDAGGAAESSGQEAAAEGDSGDDDGGGTATKTGESQAGEDAGPADAADEGGEDGPDEAQEQPAAEEDEGDQGEAEAETEEPKASANGGGGSGDTDGDTGDTGGATAEAESAPATDGNGGRAKASPVARRIAREHGIDLSTLEGTGPGGRIVKADVEAAASGGDGDAEAADAEEPQTREPELSEDAAASGEAQEEEQPEAEDDRQGEPEAEEEPEAQAEPARGKAPAGETGRGEVTVQEPSRIQQVIARRMAESKATIPHFTLSMDVDMEGAVELRDQLKGLSAERETPVPSYNDMVVKACAIALRDFPLVNGAYRDGTFELYGRVNIGVAVAGEGTLIVPTIFDADRKGLGTIATESRALAEKVRDGKISPPELSGATFSITNLGMYGVTHFTAVINPPQAAILAVGEMEPKPVVRDGEVVARNTMNLTIACDHRILSGAPAAEFLGRVKAILEQPIALAL
jgi:pyruvate dehydrogenase E2 component (dihydrolipoyllysine-residue acetyltransferase)